MGIDCLLGADGRIGWANRDAALLVGLAPGAAGDNPARVSPQAEQALREQKPLVDAQIEISAAPAISGTWRLDAAPRFNEAGSFSGYALRLSRPDATRATDDDPVCRSDGAAVDGMRQVLHELRTPLGALCGFAEIIEQQLFGPLPDRYREIASDIIVDSGILLTALQEIDRLARLRAGALSLEAGAAPLRAITAAVLTQIEARTAGRGMQFAIAPSSDGGDPAPTVAVAPPDLEYLLRRLLLTLAASAEPDEMLPITMLRADLLCGLRVMLPRRLAGCSEAELFAASKHRGGEHAPSAHVLGGGFAIRLCAAEAASAGGSLRAARGELTLLLPFTRLPTDPGADARDPDLGTHPLSA